MRIQHLNVGHFTLRFLFPSLAAAALLTSTGCLPGAVADDSAEGGGDSSQTTHESIDVLNLPEREGEGPETSDAPENTRIAHQQLSQQAPEALQDKLFEKASALEGVRTGRSLVSVPGARAFFLDPDRAEGPREAFIVRTEFAHLHPYDDGSLHIALPETVDKELRKKGWGEAHPRNASISMVYGPRNEEEFQVVYALVKTAYDFARGAWRPPADSDE